MRQASIKIYRGIQNVSIVSNNIALRRIILRAMLTTLALLALTYALLLGLLVWNIVERKDLNKEVQALSTEVSELELQYLAIASEIDEELSRTMGFKEMTANFATRRSLGAVNLAPNEF